jgi:hypothetical protein
MLPEKRGIYLDERRASRRYGQYFAGSRIPRQAA